MDVNQTKQTVEELFPSYLKDLAVLISANSKNAPAEEGAPFGPGVKQALDSAVALAKSMGFHTYLDPDGYYGYAEVGEGSELFGVLGHLDVVPADDVENWETPPFTLTEKEDRILGRGVADDKGPMLAAMYAMKLLLEQGAKLTKRVRFIFCTDEESLWGGVKAYMEKEELPSSGFTPDADFPLLYAEKGLVEYYIRGTEADTPVISGGTALNAVAGSAKIAHDPETEQALEDLGYEYEVEDGTIEVKGKAAHSMAADEGVNAVIRLAEALKKSGKDSAMLRFITEVAGDPFAEKIFGHMEDEYTGRLTFNIGLADWKPGAQSLGIDIRFPVSYTKEDVEAALEKSVAQYGLTLEYFDYLKPVHISTDTPLVQSLMQSYQEVTGDMKSQPISTGGATFARSMDNIVAYGALMQGSPKTEHQANECAMKADLKAAIAIYARAFELLTT